MSDKKPSFYITTPIFYPNGKLHIGHIYTSSVCDIFARMARLVGRPTYFLTGSDENSLKVEESAKKQHKDVMEYLDEQAAEAQALFKYFNISYDEYIRTTDTVRHHVAVQEMWKRYEKAGDIYEGEYEGYYCVGCESFKTEKDLIEGKCPTHDTVAECIKEKNYFFRLSKYTDQIKKLIESNELLVTPAVRRNEVLCHLEEGLTDISFSRPYKGQKNAILVPGDSTQSIYVWPDALANYIAALGFGSVDTGLFETFWPANVHVVGKDILRFHAEIWPAMLLSAGLPLPKEVIAHGLLLSGGRKMGKTLGNVIDPLEMAEIVGVEGIRFYFAHEVPLTDDGEITKDLMIAAYNAHLANGIGNLCNRLLKMMISYDVQFDSEALRTSQQWSALDTLVSDCVNTLNIGRYTNHIWDIFAGLDRKIQETEPFKLFKTDPEKAKALVKEMMETFYTAVFFCSPILPHSASKIITQIEKREMPETPIFNKI